MGFGCCICNETLYQRTKASLIVGDTSKIERPVVASKCGHLFHNDCLKSLLVKQGSDVWTTRHCPKCEMTLTVATDIIRIFGIPATDGICDELDEANTRIKKLQSDKEELVKRLESGFLQSRDAQKQYSKLEKEFNRRKANETTFVEEICLLRKENEDLKNTVVRLSKNMTRGDPFLNGGVIHTPNPTQFFHPFTGSFINRPTFNPYTHLQAMPTNMGIPSGFHTSYTPSQQPHYKKDGGSSHVPSNVGPRLKQQNPNNNKANSGKAKQQDYLDNFTKRNNNRRKNKEKYDDNHNNNKDNSSDNYLSSDSEDDLNGKHHRKEFGVKENGNASKSEIDDSNHIYYNSFARSPSSSEPNIPSSPNDPFFDNLFKTTTTSNSSSNNVGDGNDNDMMRFMEEEQEMLANKFAMQNLGGQGQPQKRIFGKYRCVKCGSKWGSAKTEENQVQKCVKCQTDVYPYEQGPVLSRAQLRGVRRPF